MSQASRVKMYNALFAAGYAQAETDLAHPVYKTIAVEMVKPDWDYSSGQLSFMAGYAKRHDGKASTLAAKDGDFALLKQVELLRKGNPALRPMWYERAADCFKAQAWHAGRFIKGKGRTSTKKSAGAAVKADSTPANVVSAARSWSKAQIRATISKLTALL